MRPSESSNPRGAGRRPHGSGEERLRQVIRSRRDWARREDPRPYDSDWGWWVESRITRLEKGQAWLIRIAIGALVAEILRVATEAAGLGLP